MTCVDRCALFVDAGYVLADGAMAVHGTRRRESVSWDYAGLTQFLAGLASEQSGLPLLRCYWYEATVEGRRTEEHDTLADLPGVKLRLAKMRPGRREGVESEIHRDLTTLARNKAATDAMVVSAEEDLAQVVAEVQDLGMRVTLLHIAVDGNGAIPRALRQECDDIAEINSAHLRPYVELISGAEPPRTDEQDGGSLIVFRPAANGHGQPAGTAPYPPAPQETDNGYQAPPGYPAPAERSPARLSRPPPPSTWRPPRRTSSRSSRTPSLFSSSLVSKSRSLPSKRWPPSRISQPRPPRISPRRPPPTTSARRPVLPWSSRSRVRTSLRRLRLRRLRSTPCGPTGPRDPSSRRGPRCTAPRWPFPRHPPSSRSLFPRRGTAPPICPGTAPVPSACSRHAIR